MSKDISCLSLHQQQRKRPSASVQVQPPHHLHRALPRGGRGIDEDLAVGVVVPFLLCPLPLLWRQNRQGGDDGRGINYNTISVSTKAVARRKSSASGNVVNPPILHKLCLMYRWHCGHGGTGP